MALPSGTTPFRVIVFDDERAVLELVCDFIAMEGFEVFGYDDPRRGPFFQLDSCPAEPCSSCCHAVVTDLAMPGHSGLDLIHFLRGLGCPCPNFAVVSGQLTPKLTADIQADGIATFEKPGVFPALTDWLHACKTGLPECWRLLDWPPAGTTSPHPYRGGWSTSPPAGA